MAIHTSIRKATRHIGTGRWRSVYNCPNGGPHSQVHIRCNSRQIQEEKDDLPILYTFEPHVVPLYRLLTAQAAGSPGHAGMQSWTLHVPPMWALFPGMRPNGIGLV